MTDNQSHIGLGHVIVEPGEPKYNVSGGKPFVSVPLGGPLCLYLLTPDEGRALIRAIATAVALLEDPPANEGGAR